MDCLVTRQILELLFGYNVMKDEHKQKKYDAQEYVKKRALCDWVRITGLPTKRGIRFDTILEDLARSVLK